MYNTLSVLILTVLVLMLFPAVLLAQEDGNAFVRSVDTEKLEWGDCPEFMPKNCSIAVLRGDPAKPNADIFFKLQGNTNVPVHWHHSPERMVLISGEMEVEYKGQDPKVMEAGTYAYGPAERPHKASCLSDAACVLFIAFENPIDAYAVK